MSAPTLRAAPAHVSSSSTSSDSTVTPSRPKDCNAASDEQEKKDNGVLGWFFPLHPLFALALVPILPSWLFLNRGYTQWFHWCFILYIVTGQKHDFLRRFLVIQGAEISAGWYAAVAYDYLLHGRFCHLLYNNMPPSMKAAMLVNGALASGGIITDNPSALANLAMTHTIDLLAHPLLTYLVYKIHRWHGGSIRSLLQWDVLVATYVFSRFYSVTHLYYNQGTLGLFYYGFEVYNIEDENAYTPAYVAEALCYVALICYKLYHQWNIHRLRLKIRVVGSARRRRRSMELQELYNKNKQKKRGEPNNKPLLMQSSSCFSSASDSNNKLLDDDDDDVERTC